MNLLNNDPNFSIVLPGPCDAACAFCFSKPTRPAANLLKYLTKLNTVLENLGPQFYQVSITGGEPTLSPFLLPVLAIVAQHRRKYTNVLVTSNGARLLDFVDDFRGIVDHVNLSRHHYNDEKNAAVFGGKYRGTTTQAAEIVDAFGAVGIDVSLNCVVNDSTGAPFLLDMIHYARTHGFKALRLRKENGDNEPIPAEEVFAEKYPVLWNGECPVCRTRKRVIQGLDVYFKTSVVEPGDVTGGKVFEVVYLADGLAYTDWAGLRPLVGFAEVSGGRRTVMEFHEIPQTGRRPKVRRNVYPEPRVKASASCGSPGCGSRSSCGGSVTRC